MRIFIYICILVLPSPAFSQSSFVEKAKAFVENKQYRKGAHFIDQTLKKTDEETLASALWYYKGKLRTQQYFEVANDEVQDEEIFRKHSYLLLEGIAAFQNASKRVDLEYKEMALRQIGGLHRYLKEIAFSYLQQENHERFFLNLQWARNCDRFIQQYINESTNYQMDTMLIYLCAYAAELTNRNYEAKAFYETLLLEGVTEEELFIDHYNMLSALDEPYKAERILEQALLKFPDSENLIKYKLRALMTNQYFEEAIQWVEEKQSVMSEKERARLFFVKGMAWNARYEEALKANLIDADFYFNEAEKAYQEAVSISPTRFDYAYNLAALYYNKVVLIQPDSIPGLNHKQNYALFIQRAAETLETTLNLNATDRKVIDALEDIYRRTNQTKKLQQLQQPRD